MNLVTGATGIVGSHVVLNLLQNGREVLAARQKNSDLSKVEKAFSFYDSNYRQLFQQIKWIELDILDLFSIEQALEGVTHVYHCAGYVSFDKRFRKKVSQINETGTRNVVNACLMRKDIKLCHVSSIATINNLDHKARLDETVFWKTSGTESDYAISKYNAEREVWRGMEEGLKAVIVNPGVILSSGFWHQSSGRMIETAKRRNIFYTEGKGGYIDARDVAKTMRFLMEKELFGNRYILVEGNYSNLAILSAFNRGFSRKAPRLKIGKNTLLLVSQLEKLLKLFSKKERKLSKALVNAAFSRSEYSNEKITSVLDWKYRPVPDLINEICLNYAEKGEKIGTGR